LPRPRLVLVPALVLAALLAMGGGRALAQSDEPDPPPKQSGPTFSVDHHTRSYESLRQALDQLAAEIDRATNPTGSPIGFLASLFRGESVTDAQDRVVQEAQRLTDDPTLLDSIEVQDEAQVQRLRDEAAAAERQADERRTDPRRKEEVDWLQAAKDQLVGTTKALTARLAEAAEENLATQQREEAGFKPAPAEQTIELRGLVRLHIDDVQAAAEEAGYWEGMVERSKTRNDLTEEQRTAAEKRVERAQTALDTAREKARRTAREQAVKDGKAQGKTSDQIAADITAADQEIAAQEAAGRAAGRDAALADTPSADPPKPPTTTDTEGAPADTTAAPSPDPAARLGDGNGGPDELPTVTAVPDATPEALPFGGKVPPSPGDGIGDATGDDTGENAVTTAVPEFTPPGDHEGDGWKRETGGKVEPFELKAGGGTNGGTNGGATDWFSGSIDDLIVGDTRQGPPEEVLPPGVGCGGQFFKGAFVNCPADVPEPPPGHVTPLPGLGQGGEEGGAGGCDKIELAAFSDCGLGDVSKPDIFVPGGDLDLPGPTGCGPVGVIAICTGTGGELGGTRDTATDLDRLFRQSGDPFQLDPVPVVPVVPAIPVPPGSSADLAA
jgi:hypothetical protein